MDNSVSATATTSNPQSSEATRPDDSVNDRVDAPSPLREPKSDGQETPSVVPKETSPNDALVVTWDDPDDPQDPFNWPLRKKWCAVALGLLASFVCSTNGSILAPAHAALSDEFGGIPDGPSSSFQHAYWTTTSWGVGAALFPLLLFPALEDWGVRPVLLGTYFVFVCLLVPVGFARSFAVLVAARFFSGGCVPLMSDAVASIASNVFQCERARSIPIALYVLVYLGATSLGPVIGAAVLQHLSWRWIGHIELIVTGALFPVLFIGLPESRGAAILRAKAKRLRGEGKVAFTAEEVDPTPLRQLMIKSLTRPLYMFFTEGVVFVTALWAAFSLGTIYLFTHSVEQVYGELYGWTSVQAGYVQSAIVVGEVLGTILSLSTNHWYEASATRNTEVPGTPIPEARLYTAIIGGLVGVTGGMLVYAWAAYATVHWIVITVGLTMVGLGTTAVVISIANYLIDAYSKYVASALAAVGLAENLSIAFLPLASSALYTDLGFQWASTLLGLVSLVLVATPFVVIKWGREIRSRSPFMKEAVIVRRMNSGSTFDV
ncbi:MFS general substrate transporter [Apiospora hydei]|uniref:MFS general substrate transporter n=1 Tax=Apiospora hydei TaxID=1337664 RepID=A0ABR1VVY3_9PEZI